MLLREKLPQYSIGILDYANALCSHAPLGSLPDPESDSSKKRGLSTQNDAFCEALSPMVRQRACGRASLGLRGYRARHRAGR